MSPAANAVVAGTADNAVTAAKANAAALLNNLRIFIHYLLFVLMLIVDFLAEKKPPMWTALIILFSDSYWQYLGERCGGGGKRKNLLSPKGRTSPQVCVIFPAPGALQMAVVELQRLYDKIRFLPSGNGFRYELGYPLVLKGRLLFLVWLILLHDGLDNLVREFFPPA